MTKLARKERTSTRILKLDIGWRPEGFFYPKANVANQAAGTALTDF